MHRSYQKTIEANPMAAISDTAPPDSFEIQEQPDYEFRAGELDPDFDFTKLERRRFLIGHRQLRKFITVTVSPGGVSKSMFSLLTAVSIAMDRALTGETIHESGNVWVINNEDDQSELMRRLYAICLVHEVDWRELCKHVVVDSGYHMPKIFAAIDPATGLVSATKFVDHAIAEIKRRNIVHIVVDPFVSLHSCEENSNMEIEKVVAVFKRIAAETGCSIEIVHHTRKGGGDSESHAGDADSARGASALINAARIAGTLSRMSQSTAEELELDWETEGRFMVRYDDAKSNYAASAGVARWFKLESVYLPNIGPNGESADSVGVHVPYDVTGESSERAAASAEARMAELDRLNVQRRVDISTAMSGDTTKRLTLVADNLRAVWGLDSRQALRNSITNAVPDGERHGVTFADAEGHLVKLWRSVGNAQNSPIVVHLHYVNV